MIPVLFDIDLEKFIREHACRCRFIGADAAGKPLSRFLRDERCIGLVIGSESDGIKDDIRSLLDETLAIPMPGGIESLNAGVSASILLWEFTRGESG